MGTLSDLALVLSLSGVFSKALDLTTPSEQLQIAKTLSLADGTGSGQANQLWSDTRTLVATSENLDLAGGLVDAFGDTITFTKVKVLLVHNKATTTLHHLTLSGNFLTNQMMSGASVKLSLDPSSVLFLTSPIDGYAVTADTGDVLNVDAGANTITYDIVLIGTV